MKSFERYIKDEFDIDLPEGEINGGWFVENGLPMLVWCCCCGMMMASPSAMVDHDGNCYCSGCAERNIGGFPMESDIFSVIETALERAGYKILDGDRSSVIVRHENSDSDYKISVSEVC